MKIFLNIEFLGKWVGRSEDARPQRCSYMLSVLYPRLAPPNTRLVVEQSGTESERGCRNSGSQALIARSTCTARLRRIILLTTIIIVIVQFPLPHWGRNGKEMLSAAGGYN